MFIYRIKQIINFFSRVLLPRKLYKKYKSIYKVLNLDIEVFLIERRRALRVSRNFDRLVVELERHKQRSIIVDGKLNYLLYGKSSNKFGKIDQSSIGYSGKKEVSLDGFEVYESLFKVNTADIEKYKKRVENLIRNQVITSGILDNGVYIDLGAKEGSLTQIFTEFFRFKKIVGVDPNHMSFKPDNLKPAEYFNTDILSFLNFTKIRAHFITAINFLEKLSLSDQILVLKKIYEVLEPKGVVYIQIPNTYSYHNLVDRYWADENRLRLFPISALRAFLVEVGFTVYCGVYDQNNNYISLDEYLQKNEFFNVNYQDLFICLQK